jgi:acyl-coenzyme A thioesterase PaaI-like protein
MGMKTAMSATVSRTLFSVRSPMIYEQIKKQAIETVPFAKFTGVVATEAGRGTGQARLVQRAEVSNHVGTMHAAAQFALGEAASGIAMAGALAPMILAVRPVAADGHIRYLKPAKGTITATAQVKGDPDALVDELKQQGKTRFEVQVELVDESKVVVAEMTVEWHARLKS